jgi:hypothetical protein
LEAVDFLAFSFGAQAPFVADGVTAGSGVCEDPLTVSHTGANFEGGSFVLQAGFAETEIAAVSYTLPAGEFPIVIRTIEGIFAQRNAVVETTTQWSLLIWEGTPREGILIFEIRSDDDPQLQPLIMAPGTRGTNLLVSIDPSDPDQIIIEDTLGTHTFSVGYRIDLHNFQTADPCTTAPPATHNAFPTTDADGLSTPTNNWLRGVQCGSLGCPAGWRRFSELGACRPSGDWVIRATYECTPQFLSGACCQRDGICRDDTANGECADVEGTFMGDAVRCEHVTCPPAVGACCVGANCLPDVEEDLCAAIPDAAWAGAASLCAHEPCQIVACCMPDGSCDDVSEASCFGRGGDPQYNLTCDQANCPQPMGACCVGTVCVPGQTQAACSAVGVWQGANTACQANACVPNPCPAADMVMALPPADTLDARRPHPGDDDSASAREGIGGDAEPIWLELDQGGLSADCFDACESETDPKLGDNQVSSTSESPAGRYRLILSRVITSGAVTQVSYEGGVLVNYVSHPGNANGDEFADAHDVESLVEYLNGGDAMFGEYSTDIDHSQAFNPADLVALLDLLNGADLHAEWNGSSRPVNTTCP